MEAERRKVVGRTTGVLVDINALLEQRMLAVWRSSLPPTPPEVGEQEGDFKERSAVEEQEGEQEVRQLERFLDALPQEATELMDYNLNIASIDGDTLGRGEGHNNNNNMEAVCLSDWVFGSSGPHACLSFLDRHAHADRSNADGDGDDMLVVQADNPDGDGDGDDDDDADKQALFNWLGGALVRVNRKRVWQDLHDIGSGGGDLLAKHLVERLRQALRKLAAGRLTGTHAGGGGDGSGGGDTERTALVLIECLRRLCACHAHRAPDGE
jgi:hypothetical protein